MAVPFSRVSTRLNDCIGIPYPHSEWMDLSPFLILAPPVRGGDREGTILAERFVVESESQLESNPDTGRMDRDQWPKDRRI